MSLATKQRTKPARQVRPLCALDDDELVTWEPEAPGLWRYTCTNHPDPYSWVTTGAGRYDDSGAGGIAEELGVFAPGALPSGSLPQRPRSYRRSSRAGFMDRIGSARVRDRSTGNQLPSAAFERRSSLAVCLAASYHDR
jgi:hypothetical protein